MKDKTKLYIPLLNSNGSTTLLNAKNLRSLTGLIPSTKSIQENLIACKIRKESYGAEYEPLIIEVDDETWGLIEKDIKSKKYGHVFNKKGLDIVSDMNSDVILVNIINKV